MRILGKKNVIDFCENQVRIKQYLLITKLKS